MDRRASKEPIFSDKLTTVITVYLDSSLEIYPGVTVAASPDSHPR